MLRVSGLLVIQSLSSHSTKRLFGFVGELLGGRIEKWERGLGRAVSLATNKQPHVTWIP